MGSFPPGYELDNLRREKAEKLFRSLPEKEMEAFNKKNSLEEWEKRELGVNGTKEYFPFGSPLSPGECSQLLKQDFYMELCKVAIESYNIEHHSNFVVVAVEDLNSYGLSILHHELTFTARDAKDPSAASLTFQADVVLNIRAEKKVLYCKCKE